MCRIVTFIINTSQLAWHAVPKVASHQALLPQQGIKIRLIAQPSCWETLDKGQQDTGLPFCDPFWKLTESCRLSSSESPNFRCTFIQVQKMDNSKADYLTLWIIWVPLPSIETEWLRVVCSSFSVGEEAAWGSLILCYPFQHFRRSNITLHLSAGLFFSPLLSKASLNLLFWN